MDDMIGMGPIPAQPEERIAAAMADLPAAMADMEETAECPAASVMNAQLVEALRSRGHVRAAVMWAIRRAEETRLIVRVKVLGVDKNGSPRDQEIRYRGTRLLWEESPRLLQKIEEAGETAIDVARAAHVTRALFASLADEENVDWNVERPHVVRVLERLSDTLIRANRIFSAEWVVDALSGSTEPVEFNGQWGMAYAQCMVEVGNNMLNAVVPFVMQSIDMTVSLVPSKPWLLALVEAANGFDLSLIETRIKCEVKRARDLAARPSNERIRDAHHLTLPNAPTKSPNDNDEAGKVARDGGVPNRKSKSEIEVLGVLEGATKRLTTGEILAALNEKFGGSESGESTVKSTLASFVKRKLIDNRRDDRPPGYAMVRQSTYHGTD